MRSLSYLELQLSLRLALSEQLIFPLKWQKQKEIQSNKFKFKI